MRSSLRVLDVATFVKQPALLESRSLVQHGVILDAIVAGVFHGMHLEPLVGPLAVS